MTVTIATAGGLACDRCFRTATTLVDLANAAK